MKGRGHLFYELIVRPMYLKQISKTHRLTAQKKLWWKLG